MKVLEVNNLKKTFEKNFRKTTVLENVNLSVSAWKVYWFLGPNGAGKTTLLKCILGFLEYDEWKVCFFDNQEDKVENLYKRIWYAPESPYFYDHLNWLEFLIFMWKLSWSTKQEAELNALELLDKLWLTFAKGRLVKYYSKWMKQRLWLAASLINNPELIFWDEPMSWLDPMWRVLVKNLMEELKEKQKTIFFNTHILSDVEEIADKFGILNEWTIVYEEETKNLNKNLEDVFQEVIKESSKKLEVE